MSLTPQRSWSGFRCEPRCSLTIDVFTSNRGLTERRTWKGLTGIQGAKTSRDWLMKQTNDVKIRLARIDRWIFIYLTVACCRGHDVPMCFCNRSLLGFSALDQALHDGRERLLQGSSKIFAIDVMLDFQVRYRTVEVMRLIFPCVRYFASIKQHVTLTRGGQDWPHKLKLLGSKLGPFT